MWQWMNCICLGQYILVIHPLPQGVQSRARQARAIVKPISLVLALSSHIICSSITGYFCFIALLPRGQWMVQQCILGKVGNSTTDSGSGDSWGRQARAISRLSVLLFFVHAVLILPFLLLSSYLLHLYLCNFSHLLFPCWSVWAPRV